MKLYKQSCNSIALDNYFRNRTTSARIIAHPFTISKDEKDSRILERAFLLCFPAAFFTLTGLNPFIYPRGWWEGNG